MQVRHLGYSTEATDCGEMLWLGQQQQEWWQQQRGQAAGAAAQDRTRCWQSVSKTHGFQCSLVATVALYHTVLFTLAFACVLSFTCLMVDSFIYLMSSHWSLFQLKSYRVGYCVINQEAVDCGMIFYIISPCTFMHLMTELELSSHRCSSKFQVYIFFLIVYWTAPLNIQHEFMVW